MFSLGASSPALPSANSGLGPMTSAEIALEFASLSSPNACPRGIYMTPSPDSLLKWYGVFFVHSGPYAGAALRFILGFKEDFPRSTPTMRFESEVFHPLVDPKTKLWHPRGSLSSWQSRINHVSHLLHNLKDSFELSALDTITEDEAVNKQIWSLYHHSHHTFLSMTVKRAVSTTSPRVLYPSETAGMMDAPPASPQTMRASTGAGRHGRQESVNSLRSKASYEMLRGDGEGHIAFKKLEEAEREGLIKVLKRRT